MSYTIEGIYQNGSIELIETPEFHKPVEVVVVFLENKKQIRKLGGLFKDFTVDYNKIEQDLKELKRKSVTHILDKFENNI